MSGNLKNVKHTSSLSASFQDLDKALREQEALRDLQHPCIVKCRGFATDAHFIYVALEPFVEIRPPGQKTRSLTLRSLVKQGTVPDRPAGSGGGGGVQDVPRSNSMDLAAKKSILRQITRGLAFLHEGKEDANRALGDLLHRDIKPLNVLVRADGSGGYIAKLSDLGLIKEVDASSSGGGAAAASTMAGGTPGWQAPEVFVSGGASGVHTKGTDMFSLGLVYYYVLSDGAHILGANIAQRNMGLMQMVMQKSAEHLRPKLEKMAATNAEAADLVESMLAADSQQRLRAAAALQHPFFWSAESRFAFLCACGRQLERVSGREDAVLQENGRRAAATWPGGRWGVHRDLMAEKRLRRDYDQTKVSELLRLIRNTHEHFKSLHPTVKSALGLRAGETAAGYFLARFPLLVLCTWRAVAALAAGGGGDAVAWGRVLSKHGGK